VANPSINIRCLNVNRAEMWQNTPDYHPALRRDFRCSCGGPQWRGPV
jgi:hypothetical protein